MRVLHLPTDTGGNAWGLSLGERELGVESDVLIESEGKFKYPAHINLELNKIPFRVLRYLKKVKTFFSLRKKYDVFHFNFGKSLLHRAEHPLLYQLELPLYPKNTKLFVTYNGCDARQKFPTMKRTALAACHQKECYGGVCNSGKRDLEREKCIEKMAKYVKHIWAVNPDLLYFLPKEKSSFLPYTVANHHLETYFPKLSRKLKIVHAPTNQAAKGSFFIIAALKKLQEKYPREFEFQLIENIPHFQALEIYRAADLVIDQILIGWYGAFSVETMLMGKPVIARIAEADLKFIPLEMSKQLQKTIIHADPSTIYEVIEKCINDRSILEEKARESFEYAKKWHDPLYVAKLTKEQYEN